MKLRRTITPHHRLRVLTRSGRTRGRPARISWQERLFVLFVGLLTVFALLIFLSRNEYLLIKDIQVIGNEVLEEGELIEDVQEEISGYYLSLFPKNNIFLYPKGKIKSRLLDAHKRIGEIKVRLRRANELLVKITEREGEYLWCGVTLRPQSESDSSRTELNEEKNCYFVDNEGFIFASAPYFSSNIYFTFYGLPQGIGVGSYLFTEAEFNRLILFKEFLSDVNIETYAILKKENGDYDIFLADTFGLKESFPRIIFSSSNDFEKILNNLNSALKTGPLSDLDERLEDLDYIDLRFDNKVVYKFFDQ